jgi:hypothetical protein
MKAQLVFGPLVIYYIFIFIVESCFIGILSFIAAGFIGTIVIPHLGHFPGVSEITSGCIGQVYFTDAIVLSDAIVLFIVSMADFIAVESTTGAVDEEPPLHAVNVVAAIAEVIKIAFFIVFIFKG